MKFVAIIVFVVLGSVAAGTKRNTKPNVEFTYNYNHGQTYSDDHQAPQIQHGGSTYSSGGKGGSNTGNHLKSIAQGSAHQANTAVVSQHSAASQAAYAAQTTLAQSAAQASATAQAALVGKEVLYHLLENQYVDAQHALETEIAQLELAQRAAKSAQQSAEQVYRHVSDLQAALNSAQTSLNNAQFVTSESSAELASQSAMVGKAKARLAALTEQLNHARIDFEETQIAAAKAARSADTAQSNAAAAASQASHAEQSNHIIVSDDQQYGSGDGGASYGGKYSSFNH